MLNWNTNVKASMEDRMDGVQKIILRGVLIDNTVNENNWQILEKDLPDIAAQSVGTQLRVDHSENVRDVKGKILSAELDQPHEFDKADWDPAIDVPHIHYEAELVTDDAEITIPILQGYVNHVSIGADAEHVYCSECGKPTRPIKRCNCNGHDILEGIEVKEYSIITNPAYDNAQFVTFTAAVNKHLDEMKEGDILETTPVKSESEGISITSDVTNINYYNADVKPDVETTEVKTEEKVEIVTDNEKISEFKGEVEEPSPIKEKTSVQAEVEKLEEAEVKPPMVEKVTEVPIPGEIQENHDPKDTPDDFEVNNTTQGIEDPGMKEVMAKEETNMPEDEKKKEVEAKSETEDSEYEASEVSALIASINALVAAITVEAAEEDDPDKEKVQANDGNLTEDHDTKSGNPPDVNQITPSPVDPNTESNKAPKTDKLPVTTPAMTAGKGRSAGLVGVTEKQMDLEEQCIDEIFGFAASRGVKPLEMR